MKFNWNADKNNRLKADRGISFDEIVCLIENGYLHAILKHPSRPHQKVFVVERDGYAYNVPFIEESDGTCFLKTIYPSRISTKQFLGGLYEKNNS